MLETLRSLLDRKDIVSLDFTIEAKIEYDNFEEAVEEKIENGSLGIKDGYYGNLPNFVIRVACIRRISRLTALEIAAYKAPELLVEVEDVDWAVDYVNRRTSDFNRVIEIMHEPKDVSTHSVQQPIDRVLELILRAGNTGIQHSVIEKKLRLSAAILQRCLQQLEAQNKIQPFVKTTGGRPALFYLRKTS